MNEDFLQFVWLYQYFTHFDLKTITGQSIFIEKNGFLNTDAGPDFQEAIVTIDKVKWAGNIEIHVRSSDWLKHKHQHDKAYENVILHVVWEHDKEIGLNAPTLVLKEYVSPSLLDKYIFLKLNLELVPCKSQIHKVHSLVKTNMLEKALIQRLERKSQEVISLYQTNTDWLETAYQLLLKYMGFKVNNDAFLTLAKAIPLKVLQKHRDQLLQLEALLFGQSGLLNETDVYSNQLKKEYTFLAAKYRLPQPMDVSRWKFLRLRPPNFPTIRIAQIAALIHKEDSFFSLFLDIKNGEMLHKKGKVKVSDYWCKHYHFGKIKAIESSGNLGASSIDGIAINVVTPLKFAYAIHQANENLKESTIDFLASLKQESNNKVKKMVEIGFDVKSASASQAAIELLDNYCSKKQCLKCSIGVSLLNSKA